MRMKPILCVMNVLGLTWKSVDETNQFKVHDGVIDSDSWDTESAARWILLNAMSFYLKFSGSGLQDFRRSVIMLNGSKTSLNLY